MIRKSARRSYFLLLTRSKDCGKNPTAGNGRGLVADSLALQMIIGRGHLKKMKILWLF